MARVGRKASGRLVGVRRLSRASLMRGTALQAAVLVAVELPGGLLPAVAQPAPNAQPQGGRVVAGQASIAQNPTTTTINQSSQRAAIDWSSFNVGRNETVDFRQPSSSTWTLNRVTGPDPSQIAGRIDANGNIVLTNRAGVVFYRGSEVNAGSVVISAPGITNRNFMAGRLAFDRAPHPNARIVNAGSLTVKQAGLAALVAPQVVNRGVITAKVGNVVLGGARADTLDMYGDGLLAFDVTREVRQIPRGPNGKPITALVTNSGVVRADGGTVQLTARAADGIVQDLVDAKGRVEANTAGAETGNIDIEGTGGSIKIAGDVSATGRQPTQQGGQVELNARRNVVLGRSAVVDAFGGAGGGTVAVGTSLARANGGPSVTPTHTAARTLVKHGATISADASDRGNGGKVTVLSRRRTAMRGAITAEGGPAGGNGGAVEVSGEKGFALTGSVNVGNRRAGELGTILLDPTNLTIVNGDGSSDGFVNNGTLLSNQGPAQASIGNALLDQLTGNIVLQATNNLDVTASFRVATGTNIDLRAGHLLTVESGVTIDTRGANVRLDGGEIFPAGTALPTGNGGVLMNGVVFAGGGTVEVAGGSLGVMMNGGIGLQGGQVEEVILSGGGATGVQLGSGSKIWAQGVSLAGGTLDLHTFGSGGVTQSASGTIIVGTVESSLGVSGSVSLPGTSNQISALGNFAASGSLSVSSPTSPVSVTGTLTSPTSVSLDSGGPLTISGVIVAPRISLAANQFNLTPGDITQTGGSVAASNNLIINAEGSVQQQGGIVVAGTLSGSSGDTLALTRAGNSIQNVGNFSSGQSFTLTSGGALTFFGTLTAADIELVANGNIAQTGGVILTPSLLTATSSTGSISLTSPGNEFGSLGPITASGDIRLASSSMNIGAPVSVGTGHAIALSTDTLSFELNTTASLVAPSGTVILAPLTAGRPVDVGSAGGAGSLDILPTDLPRITANTLRIGSRTAGTVNLGDIGTTFTDTIDLTTLISGNITHAIPVLDLASGAAVTEGGILKVGTLTGGVGTLEGGPGSVVLNSASNGIGTLGSFSASGSLVLADASDLTVAGPVTSPANITLDPPSITITGLVSAGGTLDLVATVSTIAETATGTVDAGVLTGSAATSISLTSPTNLIATVDALSANAGNLLLTDNQDLVIFGAPSPGGALFGTTVDLAVNGTVSEAGTGQIIATELIGNADQANLTNTNSVGQLGSFGAVSGFTLVNGESLSVTGPVTATGPTAAIVLTAAGGLSVSGSIAAPNIDLTANPSDTLAGDISQTGGLIGGSTSVTLTAAGSIDQSGGVLSTPTLNGIGTSITLVGTNTIGALGGMTATTGDFIIADTSNLAIGGAVSAAGTFDVIAPGATVSEPAGGSIAATTLAGQVGAATLDQPGNSIVNLGSFTSTGDFLLADSVPVTIASTVSTGSGATLTIQDNSYAIAAGGALNATPTGTIVLEPLTAGTPVSLTGNSGAQAFTANTLVLGSPTAGPITISNDVNLSGVAVLDVLSGASITESSGAILTVGELEGSAGGSASFGATNLITTLGSFSATGSFLLADAIPLTVAGPIDPTNVTLTAPSLTITGLVSASGTVDLVASVGSISEPGGTVDAAVLTGSAVSSVSLGNVNAIGTLANFSAGGNFTLNDTGDLVIGGFVAGDTVDLIATGSIAEATGEGIGANLLTGRANAAILDQRNVVGTLGDFATTGGFALVNGGTLAVTGSVTDNARIALTASGLLTVSGTVVAPAVDLTSVVSRRPPLPGDITQTAGLISGSTSVVLTAAGSIDQSAGVLATPNLSGSSGATTSLTGTGNAVATLASFSSAGGFALTDGQVLTVAGPVTDTASVTLNVTGALALAGTVTAPDIALIASGAITQPAGALIATGTVSGSGATVALGQAGNQVGNLGSFTSTGDFLLADSVPVTIANAVSTGTGATLTIEDNTYVIGALGALNATPTGTIVLEPLTAGTPVSLTGTSGAQAFTANTLVLGSPSAGALTISGTVNLSNVNVLDVLSSASITEASGTSLTVGTPGTGTLEGSAGGSASFDQTNAISTLGSFGANGAFILADTLPLTVAGPVDPTDVMLIAPSLTITGLVSASGTVDLVATTGAITEPGGTVDTTVLTGSAATSISLNSPSNLIGTVEGLSANGGNLLLTDNEDLVIFGAPSPGGALFGTTVDLVVNGTISEAGTGQIVATELIGSAGQANLTATSNAVASLGSFSAVNGFTLVDADALTVPGPVTAGTAIGLSAPSVTITGLASAAGTVDLIATAGGITEPTGTVDAAVLTGSAVNDVLLTNVNTIGTLANFSLGGNFALNDSGDLDVIASFNLTGASQSLALQAGGNLAIQDGVTLSAPNGLTVEAAAGGIAGFNPAGKLSIGTPAGAGATLSSNATITLSAGTGGVGITGNIDSRSTVQITSAGDINEFGPASPPSTLTTDLDEFHIHGQTVDLTTLGSGNITQFGYVVIVGDNTTTLNAAGNVFQYGPSNPTTGPLTNPTGAILGSIIFGATNNSITAAGSIFQSGYSRISSNRGGTVSVTATNGDFTQGNQQFPALSTRIYGDITSVTAPRGNITQSGGARINTVAGAAIGTTTVQAAGTLGQTGASFIAGDDVSVTAGSKLVQSGAASIFAFQGGATVTVADGSISQSGSAHIGAPGAVTVSASGDIDQTGSAFIRSDNATVNVTSTRGSISQSANASIQAATSIGLNAGDALVLGGTNTAPDVSLTATGAITQPSGAIVASGTLSGSGAAVTLGQPGNSIANLGAFTSSGDFLLADAVPVTIVDTVSTGPGASLTIQDNSFTVGALGALNATASGTIVLEPFAGQSFTLAGPTTAALPFTAATLAVGGSSSATIEASSVTLSGNLNLANVGVLDVLSLGSVSEAMGTTLIVGPAGTGVLEGQAGGPAAFAATNSIGTLSGFSADGGFELVDATGLTVAGPVLDPPNITLTAPSLTIIGLISASGTVDLIATLSTISETASGIVDAGVLTGSAITSASLTSPANAIATLDGFGVSIGGFALVDSGNLVIGGDVFGATVDLAVTGTITEAAGGFVTTPTLTGNAGAATFGQPNGVATLDAFASGAGFVLNDAEPLAVAGPVTGSTVALTSIGPLTVTGSITAPTIDLTAMSGLVDRKPVVGNILQTGGSIDGSANVVLTAAGSIDQSGGALTAGTLAGSSGATTNLPSPTNAVANLGSFTSVGGFTLGDGQPLTVAGPVTDTASITLRINGDLALAGTVTAPDVSLTASGAITQPAGAILASGTLSGSGAGVTLGQSGNQVANLGTFTSTGDFLLADSVPVNIANTVSVGGGDTLTVADNAFTIGAAGVLNATTSGTIVLEPLTPGTPMTLTGIAAALPFTANTLVLGSSAAGPITISNDVNFANVAVLDVLSGASIAEAGGATLTVGALEGQAGASASFTATNFVGTLAGFSSGGSFVLDDAESLRVSGAVTAVPSISITEIGTLTVASMLSAGTVDLTARSGTVEGSAVRGDIIEQAGGNIGVAGTTNLVSLTADGVIAQQAGVLDTALLQGSSGLTTALANPSAPGNAIANLGSFSSVGGFALSDGRALTVAGPVTDTASITLQVNGDLALAGTVTAPDVSLTASGAITQPAGAILASGTLSGSGAGVTLGQSGNQVANLGTFTSTGNFLLADSVAVAIAAGVSVSGGNSLTIEDNFFTIGAAGVLSAPGGTIVLEPLTAGAAFALTGPAAGALPFTADTLVLGSPVAGSVTIANDVNLSGVALLDVLSGGAISEAAGTTLIVGALEGQAGASASFNGANDIATLASFSSNGGFSLADGRALTVAGPVTDSTRVSLTIAGDLTLTGTLNTPAVRVAVNGAFTEPGGRIDTGRLSGNANSAILLGSNNAIASLGDFSTPGGLALNDGTSLAIAGAVNGGSTVSLTVQGGLTLASGALSSTGSMALNVAGAITDQAGGIATNTLTGTAAGLAQFGGTSPTAIASIGTLAGFAVQAGTLALADSVPLTMTGLTSADDLAISAPGSIVLSGGTIATLGLPVAQQLGVTPLGPGSYLAVLPGANGTGQFVQLGLTVIGPPNGVVPTLRIDVPNGGGIALDNLVGPTANLVLADLGGPITGNINVASLHVLGTAGNANLFGTVAGNSTPGAAAISFISPAVNSNYLLNLCVIMSPICGGLPVDVTGQNPELLVPDETQLTATVASAIAQLQLFFTRPLVSGVAPECRVVGTLATLTDECMDIILPNISDRDY